MIRLTDKQLEMAMSTTGEIDSIFGFRLHPADRDAIEIGRTMSTDDLRDLLAEAGDGAQVALCKRAMGGDTEALIRCAEVIASTLAMDCE